MQYSALIVAAGSGTRMKLGFNKVYAKLSDGTTILDKTLSVFLNDSDCIQIVLVTDCAEHFEKEQGRKDGRIVFACGGATRQDSVYNGLRAGAERCGLYLFGRQYALQNGQLRGE